MTARIFRDGHERSAPSIRYKPAGATRWQEAPLEPLGNDQLGGVVRVDRRGTWCYRIEAWVDRIASFQEELRRKVDAGQADLARRARRGRRAPRRRGADRRGGARGAGGDRSGKAWSATYEVDVDRLARALRLVVRALPALVGRLRRACARCCRSSPSSASTSSTCRRSTRSAARTARAGTTRSTAGPEDPGSPWAIGSEDGGHDAINPELGTLEEFDRLVADAKKLGIEIALDFAIQCSPDHPWLKQHPEWFNRRPDGTLKYAENPPKRYQDIYNVNFESEDWKGLWAALRDVVLFWVARGVTVFRVDNPHTKPVPFWEWLIDEVRHGAPRGDLPRRGVHAARDDDDARQGRLRAELHVLHVEEHALGAARVHGPAARVARLLPAELLREHAGHPPRVPPVGRPAGLRGAARARGDALAVVRHLLRLRAASRTCPCARAPRSTSTRRSTRRRSARSTGRCCRSLAKLNAARRENPALQYLDNAHVPRDRERAALRLPEAARRQRRHHAS